MRMTTGLFTIRIEAEGIPTEAKVIAFEGTEEISKPYRFEVHFLVEGESLDGQSIVDRPITLVITREEAEATRLHGMVSSHAVVDENAGSAIHRVVITPRVLRLTHSQHSRVFVEESIPAIVQTILHDAGFTPSDYTFQLTESYAPRDHVCQYQESSFDFISRWMEREGMYYYFEHGESQERMVIVDHLSAHAAFSETPVQAVVGSARERAIDGFDSFSCEHESTPASLAVHGYDYLSPAMPIHGKAAIGEGAGEVHLHGDHGFRTVEEAKRFAQLRAEERRARQITFRGRGRTNLVRSGYLFQFEQHSRAAFNARYLAVAVEHRLHGAPVRSDALNGFAEASRRRPEDAGDGDYRVTVLAIRDDVQYRARCSTPTPRVFGVESGVVDGALDGGPAQLDEHGRYLVRIRFDESTLGPGRASTRVRMLQPHGGSPEGFHFPLRKGTEVLLVFLGGDPDRPVIAGVVPNAHTPSPVTEANATRNIVHTSGNNRIQIEDAEGLQHIHLRTPHKGTYLHLGAPFNPQNEVNLATAGNSMFNTGGNSADTTGGDKVQVIAGSRLTAIGFWHMGTDAVLTTEWDGLVGTSNNITFATLTGASGATESTVQKLTGAPTTTGSPATTTVSFTPTGGTAQNGTLTTQASAVASPTIVTLTPPTSTPPGFSYASFSDQTGGSPPSPLNDGSDIKLVGGDNVTHVGGNNKSTVDGNQWAWVHGSQISTVDQGTDSRIFSAEAAGRAYQRFIDAHPGTPQQLPTEPKDIDLPGPEGPPAGYSTPIGFQPASGSTAAVASTTAQISTIYGDVFAWLAGNQTATVTGNKSATVKGSSSSLIQGQQTTVVNGGVSATIQNGKTTNLSGGQTTTITGGQQTTVDWTMKFAGLTVDFVGQKIALTAGNIGVVLLSAVRAGITVTETSMKIDIVTAMAISRKTVKMDDGSVHFVSTELQVVA